MGLPRSLGECIPDSFTRKLANAVKGSHIKRKQCDTVLRVLRTHPSLTFLPKSARILLKTPRHSPKLESVPPRLYLHIGFKVAMTRVLDFLCLQILSEEIIVDFNTDGGELFKKQKIWGILCRIVNIKNCQIGVVGIYMGKKT